MFYPAMIQDKRLAQTRYIERVRTIAAVHILMGTAARIWEDRIECLNAAHSGRHHIAHLRMGDAELQYFYSSLVKYTERICSAQY